MNVQLSRLRATDHRFIIHGPVRHKLVQQKNFATPVQTHVRHQIVIEWTLSPTDHDDEISVLTRKVVKEIPDRWSVGEARFVKKGKKQFIEFSATHTYSYREADFSIEILGVGKIAVLAGAKLKTEKSFGSR